MAFQHGFISFKWGPRFYLQKHQRWQNVACHLGKTTHLKHTSIIVQPKRLLRVFNPPSLCPQCACDYEFVIVLDASLVCVLVRILVSCPPASHMGSKKKSIISGTSSCCMGSKKKTCISSFPATAKNSGTVNNFKVCGYIECTVWDKILLFWAVVNGLSYTNICNKYIKNISRMAL